MTAHQPEVVPFSDVADKWVLRCGCGCGLLTEYASRDDAEAAREAAEALAACWHEPDELRSDEHLANCLLDPHAASRLAEFEGRWDRQGINPTEWFS